MTRGITFSTGSEAPKPPTDDGHCAVVPAGLLCAGERRCHWLALLELSERLLLMIGIVRARPKFGWWRMCWNTNWFNAV